MAATLITLAVLFCVFCACLLWAAVAINKDEDR